MEVTFEHEGVTVSLRRSILDDARYLAMADNLPAPEIPQLAAFRASFLMLAANTKSVSGIDWQPPTLDECADPERIQASFDRWMELVDRELLLRWQDEVDKFNAPLERAGGDDAEKN